MSVDFQRTTKHYIQKDSTLHKHCCEILKSYMNGFNLSNPHISTTFYTRISSNMVHEPHSRVITWILCNILGHVDPLEVTTQQPLLSNRFANKHVSTARKYSNNRTDFRRRLCRDVIRIVSERTAAVQSL